MTKGKNLSVLFEAMETIMGKIKEELKTEVVKDVVTEWRNEDPLKAGDRVLCLEDEYVLCGPAKEEHTFCLFNIRDGQMQCLPEFETMLKRITKTYKNTKGETVLQLKFIDEGKGYYKCQILQQDERFRRKMGADYNFKGNVKSLRHPSYVNACIHLKGDFTNEDDMYFFIPKKDMTKVDSWLIDWASNCKIVQ